VLGLFGIFLTLVARWFKRKKWKNPFTSANALFCSEAVVRVMKAAAYPGAGRLGDETTTPQELLDFLAAEAGSRVTSGENLNLWTHLRASGARQARRGAVPAASAVPGA